MNTRYGGLTSTPITGEEDLNQLPSGVSNLLVGICHNGEKKALKCRERANFFVVPEIVR